MVKKNHNTPHFDEINQEETDLGKVAVDNFLKIHYT